MAVVSDTKFCEINGIRVLLLLNFGYLFLGVADHCSIAWNMETKPCH